MATNYTNGTKKLATDEHKLTQMKYDFSLCVPWCLRGSKYGHKNIQTNTKDKATDRPE